MTGHLSRERV